MKTTFDINTLFYTLIPKNAKVLKSCQEKLALYADLKRTCETGSCMLKRICETGSCMRK